MTSGFTHETARGKSDEWWTPAWIFDAMGQRFDLDPCGHPHAVVPADTVYARARGEDGFQLPWKGTVWLNPPYSSTYSWVNRLMLEADDGNVTGFVTLTFARTGASWAQRLMERSTVRVLFLSKRVRFIPGDGQHASSPGADSMVCAWGECAGVVERLRAAGHGVAR